MSMISRVLSRSRKPQPNDLLPTTVTPVKPVKETGLSFILRSVDDDNKNNKPVVAGDDDCDGSYSRSTSSTFVRFVSLDDDAYDHNVSSNASSNEIIRKISVERRQKPSLSTMSSPSLSPVTPTRSIGEIPSLSPLAKPISKSVFPDPFPSPSGPPPPPPSLLPRHLDSIWTASVGSQPASSGSQAESQPGFGLFSRIKTPPGSPRWSFISDDDYFLAKKHDEGTMYYVAERLGEEQALKMQKQAGHLALLAKVARLEKESKTHSAHLELLEQESAGRLKQIEVLEERAKSQHEQLANQHSQVEWAAGQVERLDRFTNHLGRATKSHFELLNGHLDEVLSSHTRTRYALEHGYTKKLEALENLMDRAVLPQTARLDSSLEDRLDALEDRLAEFRELEEILLLDPADQALKDN